MDFIFWNVQNVNSNAPQIQKLKELRKDLITRNNINIIWDNM